MPELHAVGRSRASRLGPYFVFLALCLVWSTSFLLMKKAATAFSPIGVATSRVAGGAAVLGLIWWKRGRSWSFRPEHLAPIFFIVIVGFALPFCIQPVVIGRHGSAFMALAVSSVPIITIAVSIPLLRIWPTRRQFLGVLGALACLVLLFYDGLQRSVSILDFLLATTVPLGYSLANTVTRRSLKHVPPLELTFVSLGLASLCLLPLSAFQTSPPGASKAYATAIPSLLVLGVVATGIGTVLFNRLVRDHGPLFAGMTTNVVPVGALLWGVLDGESVSSLQVVALIGIIAMVSLVQYKSASAVPKPVENRP